MPPRSAQDTRNLHRSLHMTSAGGLALTATLLWCVGGYGLLYALIVVPFLVCTILCAWAAAANRTGTLFFFSLLLFGAYFGYCFIGGLYDTQVKGHTWSSGNWWVVCFFLAVPPALSMRDVLQGRFRDADNAETPAAK